MFFGYSVYCSSILGAFLFKAMYIEELKEGELQSGEEGNSGVIVSNFESQSIVRSDVKRIVVGVGARVLFYPTLLYNVFRNKLQTEFRWWDKVDEVYIFHLVNCFPNQMTGEVICVVMPFFLFSLYC